MDCDVQKFCGSTGSCEFKSGISIVSVIFGSLFHCLACCAAPRTFPSSATRTLRSELVISLSYIGSMPFKDLLAQAKSRAEGFAHHHNAQQSTLQPGSNARPPPAIPPNKPTAGGTIRPYWTLACDANTSVSEHFKHQLGDHGWGNNELQNYVSAPSNSFFHENKLVIRATAQQGKYTSARLTSRATLGRQQGCLMVVATLPHAVGVWPAVWLLPSEPFEWPGEGEIDIVETWNGDGINHSCLHWGHHNGPDHDKHRVMETPLQGAKSGSASTHQYDFVWEQGDDGRDGRLVWYIDGRAVMKAQIPRGTRRIEDWQIIMNVAMGGNVCQGRTPRDGYYDLVVHSMSLCEEPRGGWTSFERDWKSTRDGHT